MLRLASDADVHGEIIRGVWHAKRLDKLVVYNPVVYNVMQIKAVSQDGKDAIPKYDDRKSLDGVLWTLCAYETGRFEGIPNEY